MPALRCRGFGYSYTLSALFGSPVPDWSGSQFRPVWVPVYFSLVPVWSQFDPSLVPVWSQFDPSLDPFWCKFVFSFVIISSQVRVHVPTRVLIQGAIQTHIQFPPIHIPIQVPIQVPIQIQNQVPFDFPQAPVQKACYSKC